MDRSEAKAALGNNERLTHVHFTSEEWVQGDGDGYIFEDIQESYKLLFSSLRRLYV